MRWTRKAKGVAACLAAAVGACVAEPAPSSSVATAARAEREAGENAGGLPLDPTRSWDPNPLDWVEAGRDELYESIASVHGNPDYLDDAHPLVQRLQAWSDALYMLLVSEHAVRFGTLGGRGGHGERGGRPVVPRPRVRMMVKATPNGFSSSASTCYAVTVRFLGASAQAQAADAQTLVLVNAKGQLGVYPKSKVSCTMDRMAQRADPAEVARFLRESTLMEGCQVSVDGDVLNFHASCKGTGVETTRGAGGILLDATTNWITLTTGLVDLFDDERHLLGSLAHELAHYYLSHGSLTKAKYNFFYRQTAENLALGRPLPDPSLVGLGKELLALPKYRTQPISGQAYHSEIFSYWKYAVTKLVAPTCSDPSSPCHTACERFTALATAPEVAKALGTFPQATLGQDGLRWYAEYERQMATCLGSIPVRDATASPALGEAPVTPSSPSSPSSPLGQTEVAEASDPAGHANRDNHRIAFGVSSADVASVYWMAREELAQGKVPTVLAAVNVMNAQMMERDAKKDALLQRALDSKLGYYTTEQEADNLSVQWLAALGVEPHVAIDQWFRFAQHYDGREQESPFSFGYKQCRALYDAVPRWSAEGRPLLIPIGSFADTHHSKCYRIFNIDQVLLSKVFQRGPDRLGRIEKEFGPWNAARLLVAALHREKFPEALREDLNLLERAEWVHAAIHTPGLGMHLAHKYR